MYLQMIFRDAFYHADPHPGNLMLLPGGVVGVLDCGMTGRLDEELAEGLDEMLIAVVNHNSVDLEESILRLGSVPPATARRRLSGRRILGRLQHAFRVGSDSPSLCRVTWAMFSSGYATAPSPSTWTFVISTP